MIIYDEKQCDRVRVCQVEEVLVVGSLHLGACPGEKIRQKNRRNSQTMTEALKIQLDNVTCELQALQVENARLREANPELTSLIDAEHKELEELRQNLYDSRECEIQTKQEKENCREGTGVC